MRSITFILSLSLLALTAHGQDDTEDWRVYDPERYEDDSATVAIVKPFEWDGEQGKVQIFKDSRIDKLEAFVYGDTNAVEGPMIAGYRVQLMKTQKKDEANAEILKLRNKFDEFPVYADWANPDYNIQAGDCRTKLEAEWVRSYLAEMYPGCYIVKTQVRLPKLD